MTAIADLLSILDLEQLETNLFRGRSPQTSWQRVFGGQVIGQALVAACRTVPHDREPHSLHAYFILPGDPQRPIIYEVERVREGRSFATRRVKAVQHGATIFTLSASFHRREEGLAHHMAMPVVPGPEDLPSEAELRRAMGPSLPAALRSYFKRDRPFELRPVDMTRYLSREPRQPIYHVWIKANGRLPDDPTIHRCVLAYASDMTLLDTSLVAHGRLIVDGDIRAASLDHALWLHRPFRADQWLLYSQDSPFSGNGRGFARGAIFTRTGELIASVAQEGVIRVVASDDSISA